MRDTRHGQDCCFCRIYLKWKKYNTEDPVIIFSGSFIDFQFISKDHLLIFPGILELYTGIISSANSIQFKWRLPKMVVPNQHGFSYYKWSFGAVLGVPPFKETPKYWNFIPSGPNNTKGGDRHTILHFRSHSSAPWWLKGWRSLYLDNKLSRKIHVSGQIIATSHDLTPNGGLVREIPLFQENLGW